jgi:DNA-binding CsgD family transcriptional regulator
MGPRLEDLEIVEKVLKFSCGDLLPDDFLAGLSIGPLGHLRLRRAILFGLENDLQISVLGGFGVTENELTALAGLHYLNDSLFARCISGESFEVRVPPTSSDVGIAGLFAKFLPIDKAGGPYAGLALYSPQSIEAVLGPQLEEVVRQASGLVIGCHWSREPSTPLESEPKAASLTPRQVKILRLVAEGRTNRQIAAQLKYGHSTIGHELMKIFAVLEVDSRDLATKKAARLGIFNEPELTTLSESESRPSFASQ